MTEPKRREQRRTHLDASVVPVERALLARAAELEAKVQGWKEQPAADVAPAVIATDVLSVEFRALAEELHWF